MNSQHLELATRQEAVEALATAEKVMAMIRAEIKPD